MCTLCRSEIHDVAVTVRSNTKRGKIRIDVLDFLWEVVRRPGEVNRRSTDGVVQPRGIVYQPQRNLQPTCNLVWFTYCEINLKNYFMNILCYRYLYCPILPSNPNAREPLDGDIFIYREHVATSRKS